MQRRQRKTRMDDFGSRLIWVAQNENPLEVEDILTKILVRLPVKSLLICKSVCKYWQGLISSPSFMHLHLTQSQQNPSYIFHPSFCDDHMWIKTDGETTQRFHGCDEFCFEGEICSFNGLTCCVSRRFCGSVMHGAFDIRICNPATRQVLLLPPPPKTDYPPGEIGVAFGPAINEYKVFQFSYRKKQFFECQVYSSFTGSWKSIGTIADIPHSFPNQVCIDGILYCFSKSGMEVVGHILAIDRDENFSIIRFPVKERDENFNPQREILSPFLVKLEGCLCVVVVTEKVGVAENVVRRNKFDVWALQDSKESVWTKKWSDYIPISEKIRIVQFVAVRKNEILFGSWDQYFFYNIETRTWRQFNWEHGRKCKVFLAMPMTYTESLLPCNGRIDAGQHV